MGDSLLLALPFSGCQSLVPLILKWPIYYLVVLDLSNVPLPESF